MLCYQGRRRRWRAENDEVLLLPPPRTESHCSVGALMMRLPRIHRRRQKIQLVLERHLPSFQLFLNNFGGGGGEGVAEIDEVKVLC